MRLVFAPGDDEKFATAKEELADLFLAWCRQRGLEMDPFALAAALDYKYEVDGRLARWRPGDLRAMLTGWFPRKVTMLDPDWPGVVPALHAMVDFLSEKQLMDPRSAGTDELHAEIDEHAAAFLAAMADERNYDLAKFWAMKMLQHGVDLHDNAAVERFVAASRSGEIDVDQDLLDGILERQFFSAELDPGEQPDLPPVPLPAPDELLRAAQTSHVRVWLRTAVRWLGAGRTLTKTGRLTVADGRELAGLLEVDQPYLARARSSADLPTVSLVVAWARAARLVRPLKGRLVPVKSSAGVLDDPLKLWRRAFEVFGELGEFVCARGLSEVPSLFVQTLPQTMPMLWLSLYTAGGSPIPVELLHHMVRDELNDSFDVPEYPGIGSIEEQLWRLDLLGVLTSLERLGVVLVTETTDPAEQAKIAELSGRDDPVTGVVRLTPIGLWAINQLLRDQGIEAPAAGELATEDVEVICAKLVHAAPEILEAELTAWTGARDPAFAASELAGFLERADEASQRLFALLGLAQTGEHGLAAAHRIRAAGGVAGAVVAVWLVDHQALDPDSLGEQELLLGLTDQLAVLNEQGILLDELADRPAGEQVDLVHRIAAADHPMRVELLDAIAQDHPNRTVARAAGKLRLKLRNAGLR